MSAVDGRLRGHDEAGVFVVVRALYVPFEFPVMPLPTPHPWLDLAWADLGVAATSAPDDIARIHAYFLAAGHPEISDDTTAWCAAFAGACLERAGLASTRSLLARSYLTYGTETPTATPGAIAVFSRGSDATLGHVAFVVGETTDELLVLGGNQAHSVSVIALPRSRLLGLRWPVAAPNKPASSVPTPENSDAAFDHALAHVLRMEGGYSDDPYDPGGPTNLGLTMADLAAIRGIPNIAENAALLKAAVIALTPAEAAPIYRALYWDPCQAPALPPPLALFHFDTAVNHGLVSAAHMLQQALAVDNDGEIGPLTLAAASASDPTTILAAYAEIRRARYRAIPTFPRFGRGWLARVDATEAAAQSLSTTPATQPPPPKESPMTNAPAFPATAQDPVPTSASGQPKWWGQSLTIWGTIVTTLATVLPIAGPLMGIDISAGMVHQLGDSVVHAAQAIGGVIGILMTIYGRTRAIQPLMRRDFMIKL